MTYQHSTGPSQVQTIDTVKMPSLSLFSLSAVVDSVAHLIAPDPIDPLRPDPEDTPPLPLTQQPDTQQLAAWISAMHPPTPSTILGVGSKYAGIQILERSLCFKVLYYN